MTAATSQNRVSGGRSRPAHPKARFWALTLGSIGVVYGDIGTSPLYAFRESVVAAVGPGNPASDPVVLGIISGALFYGDAIITPALSVLSAVEGLKVATPAFEHYVVPLTVLILIALFAVQSRGTARVATFFGPVTLVWFVAIAIAGAWHVAQNLSVLYAFNPVHGVEFVAS